MSILAAVMYILAVLIFMAGVRWPRPDVQSFGLAVLTVALFLTHNPVGLL
jgi:hypothetical protein